MQTILPPSGNTIKILGKARSAEHGLRWMTYVLAQPVEGGVLVFHTLTRALLLLTPEEYAAPDNLPELRKEVCKHGKVCKGSDGSHRVRGRGCHHDQRLQWHGCNHQSLAAGRLLERRGYVMPHL